jgi:hypothetical protein
MRFAGLLDALIAPIEPVDRLLNATMPPWLALTIWGLLVGALSTAIYRLIAPAARIAQVHTDAAIARHALCDLTDDTEFSTALALACKSIRLSLNEVGLVAGPATAACAPGILLLTYLDHAPAYASAPFAAHSWWSGWELLFFAAALSSGLTLQRLGASRWARP